MVFDEVSNTPIENELELDLMVPKGVLLLLTACASTVSIWLKALSRMLSLLNRVGGSNACRVRRHCLAVVNTDNNERAERVEVLISDDRTGFLTC